MHNINSDGYCGNGEVTEKENAVPDDEDHHEEEEEEEEEEEGENDHDSEPTSQTERPTGLIAKVMRKDSLARHLHSKKRRAAKRQQQQDNHGNNRLIN